MGSTLRVLELYCGIGGLAAAIEPACTRGAAEVAAGVDINRNALEVYSANFRHPVTAALIESLSAERLAAFEADLWWASPPCQPFTRRGLGRDLDDPRAATFRELVQRVAAVRPRYFALENVAPFESSEARLLLVRALEDAGYAHIEQQVLCPSRLGMPNSRPRYYLLASRGGELAGAEVGAAGGAAARPRDRPLSEFLQPGLQDANGLLLDAEIARRYRHALHVVDARDPGAVTSCFTAAYGRSPVRSGSYLGTENGPRRFSPAEVLRLLGFPSDFRLAAGGREKSWRLAGNSLSIPAVRHVLSRIPELSGALGV